MMHVLVVLLCPRCKGELPREANPPEHQLVAGVCLCKPSGDVRTAHDPVRMIEVARISLEELVPVG